MTDAQLRDAALVELRETTRGLKGFTPPSTSHWAKALDFLYQIGKAEEPPLPPSAIAALPISPQPYTVPIGVQVSSYAALKTEINKGTPVIVLAPGIYDGAMLTPVANQLLISETLLGAELRCGIEIHNPGIILQGIKFKWSDPTKLLQNTGIHCWGSGNGWSVLDCELRGSDTISAGLYAYLEGTAKRLRIGQFHNFGLRIAAWGQPGYTYIPTNPAVVEDVYAEDCVWKNNPNGSNGNAEVPIFIGMRTNAKRIHAHQNLGYASDKGGLAGGIETATNCDASFLEDVTVTGELVFGIYLEHFNRFCIWKRVYLGPTTEVGFHCEWADPDWDSIPGAKKVVLEDSVIESSCIGVNLDEGTEEVTVRNTIFQGQQWCCINNFKGVNNVFPNNVYKGSAPPLRTTHYYDSPCAGPGS